MNQVTSTKIARRPHPRRRGLVEPAAVCAALAVAPVVALLAGYGTVGTSALIASAVTLIATAVFLSRLSRLIRWGRRHGATRPTQPTTPTSPTSPTEAAQQERTSGRGGAIVGTADAPAVLWRARTTVRDTPGSLAALCTAFAGLGVDILTLQTHPLTDGTVDEFLLRAPVPLQPERLRREIAAAGGEAIWIERADPHDLVDTPTRMLGLATRTALDPAELPLALRQLLGRCTIRSRPAISSTGRANGHPPPVEGVLEETVMRLRDPAGGELTVERPHLPFTPTEFARVRALVELDARLGTRVPRGQEVLTLAEAGEITVRRAGRGDADAAREMHDRCSERTLRQRYHGPVVDAQRYLDHLLSPRFGRTLAVRTASGRLIALGHLLWDGDETEVALIVEDDWQRRGIGAELLGRLVALAHEAGCRNVYAVTQSSNTAMVAAMRGLGLPLDYETAEGTLVITARLDGTDGYGSAPRSWSGWFEPAER